MFIRSCLQTRSTEMPRNNQLILLFIFGGLVTVLFPGYTYAETGNQSAMPDTIRTKIVAFGNSITATRSTIRQVFAQRLPELLRKNGIVAEIINSGIPGSHTGSVRDNNLFKIRHARDRFETDVLAHNPDLVTIGFGTNDAHIDSKVKGGPSRIPVSKFKENLVFMISNLRARDINVILITPNILGKNYDNFQNDRLGKYVKVMRKLAREYNLGIVDNFRTFSAYKKQGEEKLDALLLDGVHPNDAGHEIIAQNLMTEILKIYRVKP